MLVAGMRGNDSQSVSRKDGQKRPPSNTPIWPWNSLPSRTKEWFAWVFLVLDGIAKLSRRITRSRLSDRSPAPLQLHGQRHSPSEGWKSRQDEARRLRLGCQRERPPARDHPVGWARSGLALVGMRHRATPPTSSFPDSVPSSYR